MNNQKKYVKLVYTCTHCGESMEIDISKHELKKMLKRMSLPLVTANKITDASLLKQIPGNKEQKQI